MLLDGDMEKRSDNMERRTVKIKLEKIIDIKNFIRKTTKYANDMYIQCGNLIVDAKSLMGLFSIDLEKPFLLSFDPSDTQSVVDNFAEWIVGEN